METKNYIKLDFAVIKPYLKSIIVLPAVALFIGLLMKNIYFVVIMTVGYSWIVSVYPFSIGEKFNLDVMYSVLPGNRNQIVKGRFGYFVVLYWLSSLMGVVVGYAAHIITGFEFELFQGIMTVIQIFPLICLTAGIFYCVIFKFGYLKSRFISILPIILMYAGGQTISTLFREDALGLASISPVVIISFSLISGFLMLYIFMKISQRIYRRKEF